MGFSCHAPSASASIHTAELANAEACKVAHGAQAEQPLPNLAKLSKQPCAVLLAGSGEPRTPAAKSTGFFQRSGRDWGLATESEKGSAAHT